MAHTTVDTSVICGWLGIPREQWPPDHYTLLGLTVGEKDAARIERQVQKRLDEVRRYQLAHPEPATEALNRLAQAYVCLTDPQARQAYDRSLFGEAAAPAAIPLPETASHTSTPTQEVDPDFLALVEEEVRAAHAAQTPAAPVPEAPPPPLPPIPTKPEELPSPTQAPRTVAERGLGTKRQLYERIVRTRALVHLWKYAGKYLGHKKRRLTRPSEAREFIELLTALREEMEGFPKILGEAGQAGYLVVSMARQPTVVPTFQTLLASQRESLARDWLAGLKVLQEHQRYLRQETRGLRHKTFLGLALRAVRSFLNDNPAGWLIVLGLLALIIALVRGLFL